MGKTMAGINRDRRHALNNQARAEARETLLSAGFPPEQIDEAMEGVVSIAKFRGVPFRSHVVKQIIDELAADVRAGKLFQRPESGPTIDAADMGGPI